jgi:hypothetical protein
MGQMRLRSVLLAAAMTVLGACATGPKFYSTVNPQANFASYQTYSYVTQLGTDEPNRPASLLTQFLKAAVDREMQGRGFRYVESGGDLLVNFYVNTQEKVQARTTSSVGMTYGRYGYYGYRGAYYGPWGGYSETEVTQYTEGTLNIDLADASRRELVWEGVAIGRIREEVRQNLQAAVDTVVPQIFVQLDAAMGR